MLIKMVRDYFPSYKYNPMTAGTVYDTEKLNKELQEVAKKLVKSGWARELNKKDESVVVKNVEDNKRAIELEQKQTEEEDKKVKANAKLKGKKEE